MDNMKGISLGWGFLRAKRRLLVVVNDIFWTVFSYCLAYFLRFNFSIPEFYASALLKSLPLLVFLRAASFFLFGLYGGVLRYASVDDLVRIIKAVTVGTILFISSIGFVFRFIGFPRSVFLIDWFVILVLLGGSRFLYRIWREIHIPSSRPKAQRKILIIGAGDVGEMILRSVRRERDVPYEVVGFLDDDPDKVGRRIHGVAVLGDISTLGSVVTERGIKEVIIAIQNISGKRIREITGQCQSLGVPCKTVPGVAGILSGSISISQVRPVRVEDLLKREPAQLDTGMIERFISDKTILVTGAGGSIGEEKSREEGI